MVTDTPKGKFLEGVSLKKLMRLPTCEVPKNNYILRLLRKQSLTALESEYLTRNKILFDKLLKIKGVSLSWQGQGKYKDFDLLNIWMYNHYMDNALKAIFVAGVVNLITGSLIIGLSIGWLVYFYESSKNEKL